MHINLDYIFLVIKITTDTLTGFKNEGHICFDLQSSQKENQAEEYLKVNKEGQKQKIKPKKQIVNF